MSTSPLPGIDHRIQSALAELEAMIRERYPTATFEVSEGDDPDGFYLTPTVDVEDTEEVFDVVVGRLLELQIDQGLPVYVIPIRPIERVLEDMRTRDSSGARFWQGRPLDS